jgi:replicative DNA helicase
MLSNGQIARLKNLKDTDKLMGPDSRPRYITQLTTTIASLVTLKTSRQQQILVDGSQQITLMKSPYFCKRSKAKRGCDNPGFSRARYPGMPTVFNIPAERVFKHACFGRSFLLKKVMVVFEEKPVPIDPYFFGVWLGDGNSSSTQVTSMDKAIQDEVFAQARKWKLVTRVRSTDKSRASDFFITSGKRKRRNGFFRALKNMGVINNKHIPGEYLYNSEAVRLDLLAGLIDTDGYMDCRTYYFSQKSTNLAHQVLFLANSLGFTCVIRKTRKSIKRTGFKGTYWNISISGDLSRIPVRLARKQVTDLSVRHDRSLIGFNGKTTAEKAPMIDLKVAGDGRFLLANGIIIGGNREGVLKNELSVSPTRERNWKRKLRRYREFKESYRREPKESNSAKEKKLYCWANRVRQFVRLGKLNHQRIQQLEEIGFRLAVRPKRRSNPIRFSV